MRVRVTDQPPTEKQIRNLLRRGSSSTDQSLIAERLRQSCYLDDNNRKLSPKQRLIEQYRKDGLVLFLGAGVSKGSGIPSWTELIKRLLPKADISTNYDNVNRAFPSLLSQFDLAAHHLKSPLKFARQLYQCFYQDLKFKHLLCQIPSYEEGEATWPKWNEVVTELQQNGTLAAVGELLIVEEQQQLRRNPQIHAILTTNADNLVEIYCRARSAGRSRILTMVDRASVADHPHAISVYHLHGTLDARGENFVRTDAPCRGIPAKQQQKRADDILLPNLVFRESEYYQTIANPLSFVNHAPQSYLQRMNVLFIGTSLDDINIRRWLYNSFRERVEQRTRYLREYYCPVYKDVECEAELASIRHFWIRTKTEGKWRVPTHLVDESARKLGIQMIWCEGEDYLEVQKCLTDLKKDGVAPNFGGRRATGD
jgi:hypothetical protein